MPRLGKFLRLAHAERVSLVEATLLLGAIGLGLRLLPFGSLRDLLDRLSRPRHGLRPQTPLPAARIAWAVERMGRVVPGARSCLVQALAAQVLLARRGCNSSVRIGVAHPSGESLHAHAWVESEGRGVLGTPHPGQYTPLLSSRMNYELYGLCVRSALPLNAPACRDVPVDLEVSWGQPLYA